MSSVSVLVTELFVKFLETEAHEVGGLFVGILIDYIRSDLDLFLRT